MKTDFNHTIGWNNILQYQNSSKDFIERYKINLKYLKMCESLQISFQHTLGKSIIVL